MQLTLLYCSFSTIFVTKILLGFDKFQFFSVTCFLSTSEVAGFELTTSRTRTLYPNRLSFFIRNNITKLITI